MSQYPHYGPPGQSYYSHWPSAPAHYQTLPNHGFPHSATAYPCMPVIVPMPAMQIPAVQASAVPTPVGQPPQTPNPGLTYITNHIYMGESSSSTKEVQVATPVEYNWEPATTITANKLSGKAFAVNTLDNNLLGRPARLNIFRREFWVIRGWHNGDLIPGKYSVAMNMAKVVYDSKEIPVQNFEVLIAKRDALKWLPASNGNVPPRAIPGGRTACGETLYIGRVQQQLNVYIPGKVHPSHNVCYIGYCDMEKPYKNYDVLCLPW